MTHYVAPGRHQKVHWDAAKRVLRYLCSTSGMGLVLGGRGPIVLTGHADASWVDDSATQRSSQGYTFSLGSGSVSWRSTRSSSVLSSSCEAEIYAGAMAAQELRWLTYLLTDLGEQPRSPPVLYVDNKAMIALCQEHRLDHRTKHIALRYFLARELQQRGQLRLAAGMRATKGRQAGCLRAAAGCKEAASWLPEGGAGAARDGERAGRGSAQAARGGERAAKSGEQAVKGGEQAARGRLAGCKGRRAGRKGNERAARMASGPQAGAKRAARAASGAQGRRAGCRGGERAASERQAVCRGGEWAARVASGPQGRQAGCRGGERAASGRRAGCRGGTLAARATSVLQGRLAGC
ncbi:unnamed protein product [Closterium sp. NIES-54]